MLINLDSASTTPLYAQLVASLRRSISTGEVGVGEKLPTAADLA
ncbi:MAG TPA: GntR family transcriptional regulator, partial [Corynebacterium sp.]|nr:GntR family transcriptional regulator [Corynebacterium sp.]